MNDASGAERARLPSAIPAAQREAVPGSLITRRLTASDVEVFRTFRMEAVSDSPSSFLKNREETAATPLTDFAAGFDGPSDSAVFGTFVDDQLIAVIGLRQEAFAKRRHLATIWGVYTTPMHRRRGLSRALLQQVLQRAIDSADILALLLHVNPENLSAKSLYRSFGFNTIGHQPMSLCIDGIFVAEQLMMLSLPTKIDRRD